MAYIIITVHILHQLRRGCHITLPGRYACRLQPTARWTCCYLVIISFPCSYQILHPGRSSAYLLMTSHPAAQHGRHPTSHTSLLHNCLASRFISQGKQPDHLCGIVVHWAGLYMGPAALHDACCMPLSLCKELFWMCLCGRALVKLARLMPLYGLYLGGPPHTFLLHSSYSLWLMPSLYYVTNDAGL